MPDENWATAGDDGGDAADADDDVDRARWLKKAREPTV
jgi:hypothetical protein